MRCPKCNYNNLDGAATCNLCGELLYGYGKTYRTFEQNAPKKGKTRGPARGAAPPGRAAPPPDPPTLRSQIVCFPLNPLDLSPGESYHIGRAPDNDVILPVGMVSRKHARIEWRDTGFFILDLESHNGTFVNGNRIQDHHLANGDQVKIGPYLLEFYSAPAGASPTQLAQKSLEQTQDMSATPEGFSVGPFSGKLSEIELREIVHLMNVTRKSGRIEIKTPAGVGEVHFLEGEIANAVWGKM
ncbi:MAG: FHA domain-containing protein, partial [Planctomycetes bacterium]|nr:FHA domain-containing protein [Planctomycetota bacterium]